MTGVARTTAEILERLNTPDLGLDFFGVRAAELISALPYAAAEPWLGTDVIPADWQPMADPMAEATDYLDFAISKCVDHRGLSATRSIDRFTELAWLSGDDVFAAALDLDYSCYGAPMLKAISEAIGAEPIWNKHSTPGLERMATGAPCEPDCSGCTC